MFDQVIFIGGAGRSGTSVTRRMLGTHPEVLTFPFEYRFIIDPDGIIDFINASSVSWSPYLADARIQRLEALLKRLGRIEPAPHAIGKLIRKSPFLSKHITANSYHGWQLAEVFPDYYKHIKKLIDRLKEFSFQGSWAGARSFSPSHHIAYVSPLGRTHLFEIFREFLHELFSELQKYSNKSIIVEDNTWNLLFAEELTQLFPGAKFINVYRDPRDNIASFRSQRWMPDDIVKCAIIYRDLLKQIKNSITGLPEADCMSISIEEMVENSPSILKELDQYLSIPLSSKIDVSLLSSKSFGRWQRDISNDDLSRIEPIIRGLTEELGYDW